MFKTCISSKKVEMVKVKTSKLREVKRELKKTKNNNEQSLKKLLLSESTEQYENDILYKNINTLSKVFHIQYY